MTFPQRFSFKNVLQYVCVIRLPALCNEFFALLWCPIFKGQAVHYFTFKDGANMLSLNVQSTTILRCLTPQKNGDLRKLFWSRLPLFSAILLGKCPDDTWIRLWRLPSRSLSSHLPTLWQRASKSLDRWASLNKYGNVQIHFFQTVHPRCVFVQV